MSKKDDGKDSYLPENWEAAYDPQTNRKYYVDHNTKTTTWCHPFDRFVAASPGQLPNGWEKVDDPVIGTYYINHIKKENQWSSPVEDLDIDQDKDEDIPLTYDSFSKFHDCEQLEEDTASIDDNSEVEIMGKRFARDSTHSLEV